MAIRRVVIEGTSARPADRRDRSNFAAIQRSETGRRQTCAGPCGEPTSNPVKWKDGLWCVPCMIRDKDNEKQLDRADRESGHIGEGEEGVSVGLRWAFANKEAV